MLIEALVSLAVVAASLAAIGELIATTSRGARRIEEHAALIGTARAIEASLPGRDGLKSGGLSGETAGYRWRVQVSPFPVEPAGQASWIPENVVITVQSPSGAVLKTATVRLFRRSDG
jgi:general secretion pathway protein I